MNFYFPVAIDWRNILCTFNLGSNKILSPWKLFTISPKIFFTYKCHFFPNERRLLKFSSSKGKKCNHVNDKCPRNAWIPLQNMKICHFESPRILFSSIPRQFLFAFLSSRIAMTILIKSEKQYINFGEFLIWPKGAYPKTFYVIIFWNYCQP